MQICPRWPRPGLGHLRSFQNLLSSIRVCFPRMPVSPLGIRTDPSGTRGRLCSEACITGMIALMIPMKRAFILFVKPGMRIWRRPGFDPTTFLFIAFIANLLPYIFISRVAFLYHYLPSLVFLCIGLAYVLSKIRNWWIIGAIVLVITATFIWLLPISYGTPLIREQFDSRMLLRSWE